MEIAPNIHRIEAPFGSRFVCLYLLVGEEQALLIDSGVDATPPETLAPYLDHIGLKADRIRYVLTSHADFDHVAGNGAVKDMTPGALFLCHLLDMEMIGHVDRLIEDRFAAREEDHGIVTTEAAKEETRAASRHVPVDIALSGGERVRLGADWEVEILHTPGHSRGHLTVYDARSQTLIIADAALFNAVLNADGSPAFPPTYRFVDSYVSSIDRLLGIPASGLYTSHYPIYRGAGIAEFLHESRSYVDRVDQSLETYLGAHGPTTLLELCDGLGSVLGEWPEESNPALTFPLLGHLERMVGYGRAVTGRREGLITYEMR